MAVELFQNSSSYDSDLEILDADGYRCALFMELATKSCTRSPKLPEIRPGRKMTAENAVFVSFISQTRSVVKKVNLRTKLLRGHKKCLRELKRALRSPHPRPPTYRRGVKCLHSVDPTNSDQRLKWQEILEIYSEDPSHFDQLSVATTEVRSREGKEDASQNYNNRYCAWYFTGELTRRSYNTYLELIFANASCQNLCERFKLRCCSNLLHTSECSLKWSEMRENLKISHLL